MEKCELVTKLSCSKSEPAASPRNNSQNNCRKIQKPQCRIVEDCQNNNNCQTVQTQVCSSESGGDSCNRCALSCSTCLQPQIARRRF